MELTSHVNHLGFRQYRNADGVDVCPDCLAPYTNEGEGVLCECADEVDVLLHSSSAW